MEGLNKPRRKRGRPPKNLTDMEPKVCNKTVMYLNIFIYFYFVQTLYIFQIILREDIIEGISQGEEDKQEEEIEEVTEDGDGRRRRKRKVPKR